LKIRFGSGIANTIKSPTILAMASLYADHPFALITTPTSKLATGTKPTMYEYTASDMALAHNLFLRGLNSIYLQAPHIAKADEPAFVQWALLWCKSIHTHHATEESFLFPAIAEMSGQPDVMEVNIEQHHAFVPGIEALKNYLDGCAAKTIQYDGDKVVELIDAFGHILREHLAAEIDTLLGLQRFGDVKMKDLQKAIDKDAQQSMVSTPPRASWMI
jgi:hypothetical protein